MKPIYVVILMGAAAIGGGLVVRNANHSVQVAQARSIPPTVIAPPIPPTSHMGPSDSVPVRSAPPEVPTEPAEKPSAFSVPVHVGKQEHKPVDPPPAPTIVARVHIPPEHPAVIPLERSFVPEPAPTAALALQLAPAAKQASPPPLPEPNRATLKSGILIAVRISDALSSNLNSPGDVFSGTLDKPLIADGFVIAERGAHVRGEVVESKSAGRGQGSSSELAIRLREILASDGQRVHIVSQPWRREGGADSARNVYDAALTRGGAAVIRPATTITFRLDETVELTEKR
jgi:hypothetical protein